MNAFFARGASAIRDWCRRHFQSTEFPAAASQTALAKGSWFSFLSAARFLTPPAPKIQRPTIRAIANTATEAAMDANKVKPSIVRVIRVIRVRGRCPRPVGESRFLEQFGGSEVANS
jgi:hypothetical protein